MRTILLKRHRKVVTLAEAENSLDDLQRRLRGYSVKLFLNPASLISDMEQAVEAERKHLRSRFLYATEFEVPENRDLTDGGWTS
jgi:hypothetical protein